ncbi:MAG: HIT domain-containing protein [Phycisphaerales bacterium]
MKREPARGEGTKPAEKAVSGVPALHAPWRAEYLEGLDKEEGAAGKESAGGREPGATASFLREYWLSPERDDQNLVVARTGDGIILLNRYPYAGGHLLVALGEARGRLLEYTPAQRAKLWELTALAAALMERTLHPQGINYGINEGRAAGAGVPQHLHVHLVPRWSGDVNFMAAVGNVRVIPSALERMAERYRKAWGGTR